MDEEFEKSIFPRSRVWGRWKGRLIMGFQWIRIIIIGWEARASVYTRAAPCFLRPARPFPHYIKTNLDPLLRHLLLFQRGLSPPPLETKEGELKLMASESRGGCREKKKKFSGAPWKRPPNPFPLFTPEFDSFFQLAVRPLFRSLFFFAFS